jgi:MFS family permease
MGSTETSARADLRALLGDGRFRTLFAAHCASNVGDWLAFMALFSLSTFEWNADVLGVSVLGVAYMLPFAIVSPWAGVWVDRWDLRRVLVVGDLLRAGLVVGMAFSSQFAVLTALLFLHQAVACFFNPAQHAAIPRLVLRERLLAANALNSQAAQVTKILGPGVAGALVAILGVRGCFFLDAATFGLSAVLLATLPPMRAMRSSAARFTSFRSDFGAGVTVLLRTPRLRAVVVVLAVNLCALGAFVAVLPVFSRDRFGAGPGLMGLLLSTLGVGAALGAFAVLHVGRRRDKLGVIAAGTLLSAVSLAVLSATSNAFWGGVSTALLGFATAVLVVPAHALFQEEVPAAYLARVLSLSLAALAISQALGMGLAGVADRVFATSALLPVAAAALFLAGIPITLWSRSAARAHPTRARPT